MSKDQPPRRMSLPNGNGVNRRRTDVPTVEEDDLPDGAVGGAPANVLTSTPKRRSVPAVPESLANGLPSLANGYSLSEVFFSKGSHSSRLYKILVVGEVYTGKTSLIRRYVHNYFAESYRATVGVDFHLKIMPFSEELELRLQLWDIAGQERFTSMTRAYFKGAHGAVVLFDLTNAHSFDSVERWKKDLDAKCSLPDGRRIPVVLVANKSDLERSDGVPDDVALAQYVIDNGFVPTWFKTSAKSGQGCEEAVRMLLRYILAIDKWNKPVKGADDDDLILSATNLSRDVVTLNSGVGQLSDKPNVKRCPC